MKKTTIAISITIIILSVIAYLFLIGNNQENPVQQIKNKEADQQSIQTTTGQTKTNNKEYKVQTKNQARVMVEVKPKQLGVNESNNIFSISFNTHSVPLDFNFTKTIVLKDNLGNSYSALKWTGGNGGHHLNGDIIFPEINKKAISVNLEINNINNVERVFTWNLQ